MRFKGYNIADVLNMTVTDAREIFLKHPAILNKLDTLEAVGLGYLKLGQPANTLSGGEAQKIKIIIGTQSKADRESTLPTRRTDYWVALD